MHRFKDGEGRPWTFEINVLAVSRVKKQLEIDLLTLMDPESDTFQRLATDTVLLCEVMIAVLEDQLREKGVEPEEFLRSIDNEDIVLSATRTCMEAILSFSRLPKATMTKAAFGKMWDATARQETQQIEQAMELVESPEFDAAVDKIAAEVMPGKSSSV